MDRGCPFIIHLVDESLSSTCTRAVVEQKLQTRILERWREG